MSTRNAGIRQSMVTVTAAHRLIDRSSLAIIVWIGRGVNSPKAVAEHSLLTVEDLARRIATLVDAGCILVDGQGNCSLGPRVRFTDDGDTFCLSVALEGGRPVTISGPSDFVS